MKGRSSYQVSINVLRAIGEGLTSSEIKSREGFSRYTYQFVINRLIKSNLVEDHGDGLVLLKKGLNVLSFVDENGMKEAEKAVQIPVK